MNRSPSKIDLRCGALLLMVGLAPSNALRGNQLTEEIQGVKLNWSTLSLQFQGQAESQKEQGDQALKVAEQKAWQAGLKKLEGSLTEIRSAYADQKQAEIPVRDVVRDLSAAMYSTNTTYYGDGLIHVALESQLGRLFTLPKDAFAAEQAPEGLPSRHSGLLLKLDKSLKPKPIYQLVDEDDKVVLKVGDLSYAGYRKNLMGRWVKLGDQKYLPKDTIGENPVEVAVKVGELGKLTVNRDAWKAAIEGNEGLVKAAKIAVVVP